MTTVAAGCALAVETPQHATTTSVTKMNDAIVFAARNRLYVSRNGGRFWNALEAELPEIDALELREA